MEKTKLRKELLEKRKNLTPKQLKEASDQVINLIIKDENFIKSTYIGVYFSHLNEINIDKLPKIFPNKKFLYPKIKNNNIIYIQVNNQTKYQLSRFGIKEPISNIDSSHLLQYLLIPAISINQQNFRIGYGVGYFDRFLKVHPKVIKVGLIYDFCHSDFKEEKHDIPLDYYFQGGTQ